MIFSLLAPVLLHLANGLPVTTARVEGAPVVAVQAWVNAGAADEDPRQAGVAHLLEHLVFRPSEPGGSPLARAVEQAGGDVNAWTSLDQTVFHAVVPADELAGGLAALGEAVLRPQVDPDALDRERRVVLDEQVATGAAPARQLLHEVFASAYLLHGYRRPVIGSGASVRALRAADVDAFHSRYYLARNMHLVVVGDVEPARAAALAAATFGRLPARSASHVRRREPTQQAPRARLIQAPGADARVAIAFHAPPAASADAEALELFTATLGGVDDELGDVRARHHALRDGGLIVVDALAEPGREAQAARALRQRVARAPAALTTARFEAARAALTAERFFQGETVHGVAHDLGWRWSSGGSAASTPAIDRGTVLGAAARWVQLAVATTVAVTPRRVTPRGSSGRQLLGSAVAPAVLPTVPAVVAAPPAPAPVGGPRAATAPQVVREVLPNGLTVVVRADPSVPVVAMRAMWLGGARLEQAADAGLTSLLAAAMVRGCGARDAAATTAEVERLAGSLGSVAGRNSLALRSEWMTASWRDGFALMADCMTAPRFDRAEVSALRRAQLARVAADARLPANVAFRLFVEALYPTHPYRLPALGTSASLRRLTATTVRAAFAARYPLAGATLVIVGDVDPAEALTLARARFAAASAPPPSAPPQTAAVVAAGPQEVYQFVDGAQATVVIGFPGTTTAAPERAALELLTQHLGGQSGVLLPALRDRLGLAYQVSVYSADGVDPGYLAIYVACPASNVDAVVGAVRAELAAVRERGVSAEALARARRRLVGAHHRAMQRRTAIANAIAYYEAYGLGWQAWANYPAALAAVGVDDVTAAARRYLAPEREIAAIVRPPALTPGAARRMAPRERRARRAR